MKEIKIKNNKKKIYKNRVILSNGSLINIFSTKKKHITKLFKDNYSNIYISFLNKKITLDLSNKTGINTFLKKFQ